MARRLDDWDTPPETDTRVYSGEQYDKCTDLLISGWTPRQVSEYMQIPLAKIHSWASEARRSGHPIPVRHDRRELRRKAAMLEEAVAGHINDLLVDHIPRLAALRRKSMDALEEDIEERRTPISTSYTSNQNGSSDRGELLDPRKSLEVFKTSSEKLTEAMGIVLSYQQRIEAMVDALDPDEPIAIEDVAAAHDEAVDRKSRWAHLIGDVPELER
jgi:hypothetical protein